MDKMILINNYIAIHVGTEQIPGKRGRPRKHIGDRFEFLPNRELIIQMQLCNSNPNLKESIYRLSQSNEFDEFLFASLDFHVS